MSIHSCPACVCCLRGKWGESARCSPSVAFTLIKGHYILSIRLCVGNRVPFGTQQQSPLRTLRRPPDQIHNATTPWVVIPGCSCSSPLSFLFLARSSSFFSHSCPSPSLSLSLPLNLSPLLSLYVSISLSPFSASYIPTDLSFTYDTM